MAEQHYSMKPEYQAHVRKLEKQGMTTSDAQGKADLKYDPHFAKPKKRGTSDGYMVKAPKGSGKSRRDTVVEGGEWSTIKPKK